MTRHLQWLLLTALFTATAGRAAPALLIADGPGGVEDAAARAALGSVGVAVLAPAETATVVEAAAASGVSCRADDVGCWQAVATLAGHDDVVIVVGPEVVVAGRAGVRRSARLVAGVDGIAPAVARLHGQAGALVVEVSPAGALRIDGTEVTGGVADGLSPGPHVVSASADGFVAREETLTVVAGEVSRHAWTLEPAAAEASHSLSPALLYGGIGALGLGVVAGVAIGGVGFVSNRCFVSEGKTFCPADTIATAAVWDLTAIAVGGALGLVGVGAIVASTVVE